MRIHSNHPDKSDVWTRSGSHLMCSGFGRRRSWKTASIENSGYLLYRIASIIFRSWFDSILRSVLLCSRLYLSLSFSFTQFLHSQYAFSAIVYIDDDDDVCHQIKGFVLPAHLAARSVAYVMCVRFQIGFSEKKKKMEQWFDDSQCYANFSHYLMAIRNADKQIELFHFFCLELWKNKIEPICGSFNSSNMKKKTIVLFKWFICVRAFCFNFSGRNYSRHFEPSISSEGLDKIKAIKISKFPHFSARTQRWHFGAS